MPKPICMTCKKFYRPKKNGVTIEEGMPLGVDSCGVSKEWVPYKLWRGDLMECKGCGHQIVYGFGLRPLAEHYQKDYDRIKESEGVIAFIEDC